MTNSNAVTAATFETLHLVGFIVVLQLLVKLVFCLKDGMMKYKISCNIICIKVLSEVSTIKIHSK